MEKRVTIRLPEDLNGSFDEIAKALGLSKNAMLRVAIIKYLDVNEISDFVYVPADQVTSNRQTLPLTPVLAKILEQKEKELNTSANSLIIYACQKIVDHYSNFLDQP